MALEYFSILKSIIHGDPRLRKCLAKCRDCGIHFLTDPRNRGRKDLRCPFGCRQAHLAKQSVNYYNSMPEGKIKKKIHNNRWRKKVKSANSVADSQKTSEITLDKTIFNYIWSLVNLLEGRKVPSDEITTMLKRLLREHSMGNQQKKRYFNQRGP